MLMTAHITTRRESPTMRNTITASVSALALAFSLGACSASSTTTTTTEVSVSDGETTETTTTQTTTVLGDDSDNVNAYENTYFGFAYTLPDGLDIDDEEELAEFAAQNNLQTDASDLAEGESAIVMHAAGDDDYQVQVFVNHLASSDATIEEYVTAKQAEIVVNADARKEDGSIDDYTYENMDLTVDNTPIPADVLTMTQGDETICELTLYFKTDDDVCQVVFLSPSEDESVDLARGIALLDE